MWLLRRGGVAVAAWGPRVGPRLLTRLILLTCSASVLSLLFIGDWCGQLRAGQLESRAPESPPSSSEDSSSLRALSDDGFGESESTAYGVAGRGLRSEVGRLNAQVMALKGQLLRVKRWSQRLAQDGGRPAEPLNPPRDGDTGNEAQLSRHPSSLNDALVILEMVRRRRSIARRGQRKPARKSEAWPGSAAWAQGSEYEVIPFTHFSLSRLHPPIQGMGHRVIEKPLGFRRKDLMDAALAALQILNTSPSLHHLSLEDFLEGAYRTEPTSGTQYELFFRIARGSSPAPIARVTLLRPFAPLKLPGPAEVRPPRPVVHVILPLSSKCPQSLFESFMDKFARIAIRNDRKVTLTAVHFGGDGAGLGAVRRVMARVSRDTRFRGLRLLALNTTTSRAAALHAAVEACCTLQTNGGHLSQQENLKGHHDPLLFLTDVDAVFSARFLDRCRWHASPGRKVYYPIAFGLFNPRVVYSQQGRAVPPEADRLLVSRDTGSWRDSLFSLSCQHRSDFLRESEAEEATEGPIEDVALYRRHAKSSRVRVIRSTDPGLFVQWRRRPCPSAPPNGNPASIERVWACRRARALTEGSHAQMGLLAFRDGDESAERSDKGEIVRRAGPPPPSSMKGIPATVAPDAVSVSSQQVSPNAANALPELAEDVGKEETNKVVATKEETKR